MTLLFFFFGALRDINKESSFMGLWRSEFQTIFFYWVQCNIGWVIKNNKICIPLQQQNVENTF